MVVEVLVDGLVAEDEAEAAASVDVDGGLEVEVVEGDDLFAGFASGGIGDDEVELAVDEPVVGDAVDGAVGEDELRKVGALFAVVNVVLHRGVDRRGVGVERKSVVAEVPVKVAVGPAAGVVCPGGPQIPIGLNEEGIGADREAVRVGVDGPPWAIEGLRVGAAVGRYGRDVGTVGWGVIDGRGVGSGCRDVRDGVLRWGLRRGCEE
jgi:hypothetical protein